MRYWFIPVHSGDFRLEAVEGADHVKLSVEDPTDLDRRKLTPFFRTLVDMGTISKMPDVSLFGRTELLIPGTVEELGPLLAGKVHEDAKLWTAVRHANGTVSVVDGTNVRTFRDEDDEPKLPVLKPETRPTRGGAATAAATVKEPVRGCPPPETARRRASEVLRVFSTRRQWEQWEEHGAMQVIGHQTGLAYWLHHRSSAVAHGLGHLLVEAASGQEICVWDDRVPAEEEALAIKMAVEHREPWLRHGLAPRWADA